MTDHLIGHPEASSVQDNNEHLIRAARDGDIAHLESYAAATDDPAALCSVLDAQGFSLVHWACVSPGTGPGDSVTGDDPATLRYLITQGCAISCSPHTGGAHPIHWASVRGHIKCVELLLAYGEDINVRDAKGVTPLITASQYGHATLATYLMGKGALLRETDNSGDNPLHWAAFRGHTEVVTLLLYSGFNSKAQDTYKQTPLHLACLNGHADAVRELCQLGKADVEMKDINGHTGADLARARMHDGIVTFLEDEAKRRQRRFRPLSHIWVVLFGSPGKSKSAMLFYVLSMLLWAYPLYIFKILPATQFAISIHLLFITVNIIMWISFYRCYSTDPGYLPCNTWEYHNAIKQISQMSSWSCDGWSDVISRLCHMCRTIKPLRSKHCRICNRCVLHYDHHCPWIYNCVGLRNRVMFLVYAVSTFAVMALAMYFVLRCVDHQGYTILNLVMLAEAAIFAIATAMLTFGLTFQALMNVTTAEMYEYGRFSHPSRLLSGGRGSSSAAPRNPYFTTPCRNVAEFLGVRPPHPDTVLLHSSTGGSGGIHTV